MEEAREAERGGGRREGGKEKGQKEKSHVLFIVFDFDRTSD